MPNVLAQGKTIEWVTKSNLRTILLQNGIDLYNDGAKVINCPGIGSCRTCAVKVEGEVSAANCAIDHGVRFLPILLQQTCLRNSQTLVLGDVKVTKFDGFWGQGSRIVWTPKG